MKKTINILQTITVAYGLALCSILLISLINVTDQVMIFIILPLPIVIAIYEYLHVKELKQAYKQAHTLYDIEIDDLDNKIVDKDKKIANYILLDNVRYDKIRKYEKEISELKIELAGVIKFEVPHIQADTKEIRPNTSHEPMAEPIPFNEDNDNIEELHLCPECGSNMRECPTMWICKNLVCKKRVKKEENKI